MAYLRSYQICSCNAMVYLREFLHMNRGGILALCVYLVLVALAAFGLPIPVLVLGIVALVTAILIFAGK